MELVLTAEQKMISEAAVAFFKERGVGRLRALRDEAREGQAAPTFSRETWREMADLGWLGLLVPEADGGLGLGLAEAALVVEAAGAKLAPEPLVGSAVYGTEALVRCGDAVQKGRWLPRLIAGEAVIAVASEEARSRGELMRCEARAEVQDGVTRLFADKREAIAGAEADVFIVTTRGEGGLACWLVERDAPGVTVTGVDRVDAFPAARVVLDGVVVDGVKVSALGSGAAVEGLSLARERATVALAAEMLGGMAASLEMTLGYLHEREQFGVKIGTFQALRHRAARCYVELELAKSAVLAAARQCDVPVIDAKSKARLVQAVSLAKARCSDAYDLVTAEAIQLHGGIGVTDEHVIGFYYKRSRVAAATFGDASFHRDRWARVAGY
jgi:acyl-CoA dehydrogenase